MHLRTFALLLVLAGSCDQVPAPEDLRSSVEELGPAPADAADPADLRAVADLRPVARTVVVIGSSTAAGVGASAPERSWVGRMKSHAAARCPLTLVKNLGVGGYTTWQGMPVTAQRPAGRPVSEPAHNVEAALAMRPDLVLILFPSNDAANKYSLSETLANHTAMRDAVRAAGVKEMIIGPFPRQFGDTTQVSLMTALRDGLPALGAPRYLALWPALAKSDTTLKDGYGAGDGIHLSDTGHALLADLVLATPSWAAVCAGT